MRYIIAAVLAFAITTAGASAGCLARSQNAIAAVQLTNAYSISRYTWAGDPQYDQVMPFCSKTALREFGCNVAFNVALREIEDKALADKPKATKTACILNYLGAIGFGLYIRHAIGVQLLSIKF